jgi:hypothetical protein
LGFKVKLGLLPRAKLCWSEFSRLISAHGSPVN